MRLTKGLGIAAVAAIVGSAAVGLTGCTQKAAEAASLPLGETTLIQQYGKVRGEQIYREYKTEGTQILLTTRAFYVRDALDTYAAKIGTTAEIALDRVAAHPASAATTLRLGSSGDVRLYAFPAKHPTGVLVVDPAGSIDVLAAEGRGSKSLVDAVTTGAAYTGDAVRLGSK